MQKHFGKAQCGQRGISTLVGIIIIVIVAVILFGGVFAYQYFTKSQNPISNAQPNPNSQDASVPAGNTETNSSPAQNQQATEGWKTYRNDEYGFEFRYPSNFNIDEKNENGITLSDYERGKENFDESQRYISIKATGIPLNSQNKNTTPVLQESCIGNKKENTQTNIAIKCPIIILIGTPLWHTKSAYVFWIICVIRKISSIGIYKIFLE